MKFIKWLLDQWLDLVDWLRDCMFIILLVLFIIGTFSVLISFAWWCSGKKAEVYERTTGNHVTQRDMFFGGNMFKILPADIIKQKEEK